MTPLLTGCMANIALRMLRLCNMRAFVVHGTEAALVFNGETGTVNYVLPELPAGVDVQSGSSILSSVWALAVRRVAIDETAGTTLYAAVGDLTKGTPAQAIGELLQKSYDEAMAARNQAARNQAVADRAAAALIGAR